MTTQPTPSKSIHISLWIAQILLAAGMIFGGATKLFTPIGELAAMWPWAGEVPVWVVKGTGVLDLLGVLGLILPSLLRIQPKLTPIAAVCIFILMVCASVFHIARGEASQIGVNVFFALLAVFIAWGRFRKAPIPGK